MEVKYGLNKFSSNNANAIDPKNSTWQGFKQNREFQRFTKL